jgi:hypothetical protein
MKTTTENFHAMRGHVAEGCVIVAPSGKEFTIKSTINGWMIYDNSDNLPVSGYLPSAYDVEHFVIYGLGAR